MTVITFKINGGGIDIINTDGTYFRSATGWQDQNGISGHPATNISALSIF